MNRKLGFTLIELLVVIAIIAIIAAILFPVFAQAREKARQITCVSNLKQIGLAIIQYTQDYDEMLPPRANTYPGNWKNLVNAYAKATGVFACPSNQEAQETDFDASGIPPSYSLNTDENCGDPIDQPFLDPNPAPSHQTVSIASLAQPSSTIGVVEDTGPTSDFRITSGSGYWSSPPGEYNYFNGLLMFAGHNDVANFAFMDGHVKGMKPLATLLPVDGGSASTNMWTNDGRSFVALNSDPTPNEFSCSGDPVNQPQQDMALSQTVFAQ